MKILLFEASPIDPTTNLPVTVRMCSAGTDRMMIVDGDLYQPSLTNSPTRAIRYSNGQMSVSYQALEVSIEGNLGWTSLVWEGCDCRIFVGESTATAITAFEKVFEGLAGAISADGLFATIPLLGNEARWNQSLLTASYAGTGGAEGPTSLTGTLKPYALGNCQNVEPILIDANNLIYQYHGYGATQAVDAVYENALTLGAPASTVTTYSALAALSLNAGQWAAAPAVGMFRLGGEPSGLITADVRGHKVSGGSPNLINYSRVFASAWGAANVTITDNFVTAHDGTNTGARLKRASAANSQVTINGVVMTSGQRYVASVYVKATGSSIGSLYGLRIASSYANRRDTVFDLSTGKVHGSYTASSVAGWNHDTEISYVGNGWYRCSVAFTPDVSSVNFQMGPASTVSAVGSWEAADGLNEIYVSQFQIEAGSKLPWIDVTTTGASVAAGYVDDIGKIALAMADVAGVPRSFVDTASLQGFGEKWSLYATSNLSIGDLVRGAFAQASGYVFTNEEGVLKAGRYLGEGPLGTLTTGAQRQAPYVIDQSVKIEDTPPPVYRVRVGHSRNWKVQSASQISEALTEIQDNITALETAAQDAQDAANQAQADATALNARMAAISDDGVLDRSEKPQVAQRASEVIAEQPAIYAQGTAYGITTERDTFLSQYNALISYLGGLSPAYDDFDTDTTISRTSLSNAFKNYSDAKIALLQKIADKTAERALWAQVTGSGKPADNADVTGSNISAGFTGQGSLATQNDIDPFTQVQDASWLAPWRSVGTAQFNSRLQYAGNSIKKLQTTSWDGSAMSYAKYARGCFVVATIGKGWTGAGKDMFFGLTAKDSITSGTSEFNQIDYAIYISNNSGGHYEIRNSGTTISTIASLVPKDDDTLVVRYRNNTVEYLINDVLKYSQTVATGQSLRGMVCLGTIGSQLNNLSVGAYADGEKLDTVAVNADVTGSNISAGFTGQGALATQNTADWASYVSGKPSALVSANMYSGIYIRSDYFRYVNGDSGEALKPATTGADKTGNATAAAFTGQGALATRNDIDPFSHVQNATWYSPWKPIGTAASSSRLFFAGNSIKKYNLNAWDGSAFSRAKYARGCFVMGTIGQGYTSAPKSSIIGLTSKDVMASSSSEQNEIDYGILVSAGLSRYEIYSFGSMIATVAIVPKDSDSLIVRYRNGTVEYLINDVLRHTQYVTVGQSLRGVVCMGGINSQFDNLFVGAYADGEKLDTVAVNADVTGSNIAAGFAGQGTGATANSVAQLNSTDNTALYGGYKPQQNLLYNGGFKLGFNGWTSGGFGNIRDWRGSFVEQPLNTGGTFVLKSTTPINAIGGQTYTLSADFWGVSNTSEYNYVDIEWRNGGNNALINYSSGTNNGCKFQGGSFSYNSPYRVGVALTSPSDTDGSGWVKGYVRVVSIGTLAYQSGQRVTARIKVEAGGTITAWNDDRTDGAVADNLSGRVKNPMIYNISLMANIRNTTNLTATYTVNASDITVNIPAHTRYLTGETGAVVVNYSAYSGVLPFATNWNAYVVDPDYAGGSPSIVFTTNPNDLLVANRIQIASGKTPTSGGSGGSYGGGGGDGSTNVSY